MPADLHNAHDGYTEKAADHHTKKKVAHVKASLSEKMCLTVRHNKRQNPHSCLVRIKGITILSKAKNRRRRGRPLRRNIRASLHAYGGTFDSVTCHQRRYHYARLRIMASSRAVGCIQRWCCSLCRRPFTSLPTDDPGAPAAWLPASRTYLLALFSCNEPPGSQKRTVSDALL